MWPLVSRQKIACGMKIHNSDENPKGDSDLVRLSWLFCCMDSDEHYTMMD
jgi:hypothetical protein